MCELGSGTVARVRWEEPAPICEFGLRGGRGCGRGGVALAAARMKEGKMASRARSRRRWWPASGRGAPLHTR